MKSEWSGMPAGAWGWSHSWRRAKYSWHGTAVGVLVQRLTNEVALLQEELRIKDARIAKIDPRQRPHYPATERMAILELKAAVIERFIRTLKDEGLQRVLVPLNLWKMRAEVNAVVCWYNRFRPRP